MKYFSLIFLVVLLSSCAKARLALPSGLINSKMESFPGVNKDFDVSLGEYLMIEQSIAEYKTFEITEDFSGSIPGSMGFPFDFYIKKCVLKPVESVDEGVLYCAPVGKFTASHSMLGVVVNDNDQIGIVVGKDGIPTRWFVDNSSWNNMRRGDTYWDRRIHKDEMTYIGAVEKKEPNLLLPHRYIQLTAINWPTIKLRYVENWNDNSTDVNLEAKADGSSITIKQFQFNIKMKSNTVLLVHRIE